MGWWPLDPIGTTALIVLAALAWSAFVDWLSKRSERGE